MIWINKGWMSVLTDKDHHVIGRVYYMLPTNIYLAFYNGLLGEYYSSDAACRAVEKVSGN